jgi:hypothetical protein
VIDFWDGEQGTPEWFQVRSGKLTFSNLGKVMANYGKAFGEPAKQLAVRIALEQITGKSQESDYTNDHMERGISEEPIARALYEDETFCDVAPGGFFTDGGFLGCSPDGLVGEQGLIEIKSAIPSVHYARVKRQGLDPTYKWQCIGNLMLTEREWLDFISYCSGFPSDKRLFVFRVHRSTVNDEVAQILSRTLEFEELVIETRDTIQTSKYMEIV